MDASKTTKYRKRKAEVASILNKFSLDKSSNISGNVSSSSEICTNIEHSIPTISTGMMNSEVEFDEFCPPDTDDESEDEEDSFSKSLAFKNKLARWGLNNNITHVAMKELLHILRDEKCGSSLPKDPRTLFRTPKYSSPVSLGTGKFWDSKSF